eukprot:gnl/TRDRNA2_/TRDRNA2_144209_c4_seq1.p1 gnl/TRDRNA2_/TRDRNA2_144209_c4~~gnl/TRDRNA2_/TRDRNA2_144209_c4_seq1.p1  ORF type:complete len:222 (+),score=17.15 gnl/TRDRNA2_/TRDRNA2_144209_c4_seq1:100-666(+)
MYSEALISHPMFFHISATDRQFAVDICNFALQERALPMGQDCFHFGVKSEKMMCVTEGSLEYFVGPEDSGHGVPLNRGAWLCEMVLWMVWYHRGELRTQSPVDLLELDAALFHEKVKHRRASFRFCLAYAENYMEILFKALKGTDKADKGSFPTCFIDNAFPSRRFKTKELIIFDLKNGIYANDYPYR